MLRLFLKAVSCQVCLTDNQVSGAQSARGGVGGEVRAGLGWVLG